MRIKFSSFVLSLETFKFFALRLVFWDIFLKSFKFFVLGLWQVLPIQSHVLFRSGTVSYTIYLIISSFPFSLSRGAVLVPTKLLAPLGQGRQLDYSHIPVLSSA